MMVEWLIRDAGTVTPLCDAHGRQHAQRLGLRLPLPHEHAAVTVLGSGRRRDKIVVRRVGDSDNEIAAWASVPCAHCEPPPLDAI